MVFLMTSPSPSPLPPTSRHDQAQESLAAVRDDLAALDQTELAQQPAVFQRIHRQLVSALDATAADTAAETAAADYR